MSELLTWTTVYGVWARGDGIESDYLLGLYRSRLTAETAAAKPPVYNTGSQFEYSPECYVDEHPVLEEASGVAV